MKYTMISSQRLSMIALYPFFIIDNWAKIYSKFLSNSYWIQSRCSTFRICVPKA